jgi:hypothetical protein
MCTSQEWFATMQYSELSAKTTAPTCEMVFGSPVRSFGEEISTGTHVYFANSSPLGGSAELDFLTIQ